jgi:hypothetical protein
MIWLQGKGSFIFLIGFAMSMRASSFSEFFPDRYKLKLEAAKDIPEIFELVMKAVQETMGFIRSGLELGLVELAGSQGHFIGCLHPIGTNMIVVNRLPLERVKQSSPQICKSYLFHVLLHEYLHTVGIWNEKTIHEGVLATTRQLFGDDHPATKLAEDVRQLFPYITYPIQMRLPEGTEIMLVE